ncbi:resolvase [Streptomyces sp. NBC_01723]|uniref:resolvase n=1 Tax=Streptomyces sp. NBC_01723 TaxID=2975921 RepID=UPI002E3522C6|nr:resolvase [Streptomyces sp. NBC_01723]
MRTAYLDGRSIADLARAHGVSRGAVRTAIADLVPEHVAANERTPTPELPVTLDMPGKVADFLRAIELDDVERAALDHGQAVRRGRGYTLRVSTVPAVHRQLLDRFSPLTALRRSRRNARPAASTKTASTCS